MKKPPIKIKVTPELIAKEKVMSAFLKSIPEVKFKKLYPLGFQLDVSTMPTNRFDDFLTIASTIEYNF